MLNWLGLPVAASAHAAAVDQTMVLMHWLMLVLSSKDVVHSFALPQMRVKQDAIPGIAQPVWFTPTETGRWEIPCSQLCGLGHFGMKGFYTIHTQADYDAWLARESAALMRNGVEPPASPRRPGLPARGPRRP